MPQYVDVIVGGQYGSEAKGHVTAQIVNSAVIDAKRDETLEVEIFNVRVAGPNAGHTVYDTNGEKFAFRQLPVGAVIDDSVKLYLAPGSEIDFDVLLSEINQANDAGHATFGRLYVSKQATVIEAHHKEQEAGLVGAIGSTGKGIGAARADRLLRGARTMYEVFGDQPVPFFWAEPEDLYAHDDIVHERFTYVIIEGTQGFGLSLRASGHYPQVTSSDARAVDFLAMAGVDPTRCSVTIRNWVVCRVYPIRVAGNSGPMQGETTWEALGLPEERTTVTQKVRRVGEWDVDLVKRAVQANGGHQALVVITMLDQVIPELADVDPTQQEHWATDENEALEKATKWIEEHAGPDIIGANVAAITFGPTKLLFTSHAENALRGGPGPDLDQALEAAVARMFGGDPE